MAISRFFGKILLPLIAFHNGLVQSVIMEYFLYIKKAYKQLRV